MTYEEMLENAMGQIARYSWEWTNYNVSDPGITILEHLCAFQAVQQEKLKTVTHSQKLKLLKLTGIEPNPPEVARVLIGSNDNNPITYPRFQKFMVGETCYETEEKVSVRGNITAIYTESEGERTDCTWQMKQKVPAGMEVFGRCPKEGNSLWIVLDQLPLKTRHPLIFYLELEERFPRNPFCDTEAPEFAKINWSVYTREGFQPVLQVKDETAGFLRSGQISIVMGVKEFCRHKEVGGYVLKGTLAKAEYDIPPRIGGLHGSLFCVCQRDTQAVVFHKRGMKRLYLNPLFAEETYFFVYGKEYPGADGYYFYQETTEPGQRGRYYEKTRLEDGKIELRFSKENFGYIPAQEKNCLCIVCCSRAFLEYRKLERAYGYDNQYIPLYGPEHIEKKSLCVMTEKEDKQGNQRYQFFFPEETQRDALVYTYEEAQREICIHDAGVYEGAQLYLCGCAGYLGEEGNVREHNMFVPYGQKEQRIFQNPVGGTGGCLPESLEHMCSRLTKQMQVPECAVTAKDYESMVKQVPGLCIHKVCAIGEREKNEVTIVVKPYGEEQKPSLSEYYRKAICRYLEEKRLLTVRITVKEPVYVPVDAEAAVYLHRQYESGEIEIRRLLEQELDFVHGAQEFGATISFNQIFEKIKSLPCVEHIENLTINSRLPDAVKEEGLNLKLRKDALCCPGTITLQIRHGWRQG